MVKFNSISENQTRQYLNYYANHKTSFYLTNRIPMEDKFSNLGKKVDPKEESEKFCAHMIKVIYNNELKNKNPIFNKYKDEQIKELNMLLKGKRKYKFDYLIENIIRIEPTFFEDLNIDVSNYRLFYNTAFEPYPQKYYRIISRIYVNPLDTYYEHFISYVSEKAYLKNMPFSYKGRLTNFYVGQADRLILYTDDKNFTNLVQILEDYANTYPKYVANFYPVMALLGKINDYTWCGYGFEPPFSYTTNPFELANTNSFNSYMEEVLKYYIYPYLILHNYKSIIKSMNDDKRKEFIGKSAKNIALDHKVNLDIGRKIITSFSNRQFIKEFETIIIKEDKLMPNSIKNAIKELNIPLEMVVGNINYDILSQLKNHKANIDIDGKIHTFNRYDLFTYFEDLESSFREWLKDEKNLNRASRQMMKAMDIIKLNTPFIADEDFAMNIMMYENVKENRE